MWAPFVLFLVSGLIAAYAERAYFASLVASGTLLRTDESIADDIRRDPKGLFRVLPMEVTLRLLALAARQQSPKLERQRRVALLSILVTVGCFAWWVWLR